MQEVLATTIDPQEHVDAIYSAAEMLRSEADIFFVTNAVDSQLTNDDDAEVYARIVQAASNLEAAAEACIDVHTERDELLAALVELRTQTQLHEASQWTEAEDCRR